MTTEEVLLAAAKLLEEFEEEDYDTGFTYYRLPDGSFHDDALEALKHIAANLELLPGYTPPAKYADVNDPNDPTWLQFDAMPLGTRLQLLDVAGRPMYDQGGRYPYAMIPVRRNV